MACLPGLWCHEWGCPSSSPVCGRWLGDPPGLADGDAQRVKRPPLGGGHEVTLHFQSDPHGPEVSGPLTQFGGDGGGVAVEGGQGEG